MKKVLRWVILMTKGGYNRAKIIKAFHALPSNTHQLSKKLDLNYRIITHHLDILEEMNVVESSGKNRGRYICFLTGWKITMANLQRYGIN